MTDHAATLNMLEDLAKVAKARGASGYVFEHRATDGNDVKVRLGEIEAIESANPEGISIRVHFGSRIGVASTDSVQYQNLVHSLDRAIAMAKVSSQDKNKALTDPDDIAKDFPDLETNDPRVVDTETLIKNAKAVEAAALSDSRIINSDGGGASTDRSVFTMVCSNGFSAQQISSSHSFYASVIAGTKDAMETDYAQSFAIWYDDLKNPEEIGKLAAERTASKLNSIKMQTGRFPVIFDPRISGSLVRIFSGCVAGNAAFKKTTFLHDKMEQRIFPKGVSIVDDPLILRGLGSESFDRDGVGRKKMLLVEDGVLQSWITNVESARKLKMRSTGHANGLGNAHMSAGILNPDELIADIKEGLYVTGFMGTKASAMTGEYSSGASGFLIKDGKVTPQAVSEVTIAGTLSEMFAQVVAANNLDLGEFRTKSSILAPTLRFDCMTIGGK